MKDYSLKTKIFVIFSIPVIVILFFAYNSIKYEYSKLHHAEIVTNSSKITKTIINLVKNIQLERGLSAGHIIATDKTKIKPKLLKQYKKTDEIIKNFFLVTHNHKCKMIDKKAKPYIHKIKKELKNIEHIRKEVLNSSIKFKDEIKYYSSLNKKLMLIMKRINFVNKNYNIDSVALIQIETIKELEGLQRAHIYYQLLGKSDALLQKDLHSFEYRKQNAIDDFLLNASTKSIEIYKKNIPKDILKKLEACKTGIINSKINKLNATECFELSTKYIQTLNNSSKEIFENYLLESHMVERNAINSLYLILFLWLSSFVALGVMFYVLANTLKKEESYINKLRIASYAFDSQEAMVITDKDAYIVEVNKAFSQITGYTPQEAIGNKTNILKSGKHDKEFFEKMWQDITTKGRWHGEIFNKRKNGEIYPESLSITAIKNDNGEVLNYIAQFMDISDIKKAQKEAEFLANHDFLTNILNRRSLIQRLQEEFQRASRHNFKHAFLFIDLDNFKKINDTYGHSVGDMLIIEVSKRLKSSLRKGDILARISGDEFGIIALNIDEASTDKAIDIICNKILALISKEFILEGNIINISSSIGVKIFPNKDKNIQDVITHADAAMYMAKHNGKNNYVLYHQTN
jgi:diguanylate cyclase (GGDEF)-like protein/PAS domain S-box-containing protein